MLIFPTVLILALVQSSIVGYYQVFFMESSLLSVMSLVSGLFPPICTHDGLNFDSAWRSEMKVAQSHPTLCDSMGYTVHGILQARILERVAFPFSRGIFPTQGSNPGLPHCKWILYQLSHKGSPRILERVVYPFSSGSSQPRNRIRVLCIAGGFFTSWATREI